MKKIINSIKDFFRKINLNNKHNVMLLLFTFIFGLISSIIFGNFSCIMLMIVFSVFYELSYCFVPKKTVKILGIEITLYDYSKFREMLKNEETVILNEWDKNRFHIVILSILLFLIFKIL